VCAFLRAAPESEVRFTSLWHDVRRRCRRRRRRRDVRSPGTRPYLPEVNFLPCEGGLFLPRLLGFPSTLGPGGSPARFHLCFPPAIFPHLGESPPPVVCRLINSTAAGRSTRERKLGALRGTSRQQSRRISGARNGARSGSPSGSRDRQSADQIGRD